MAAVRSGHHRLGIVSAERIRGELDRLVVLEKPSVGLWFVVDTGLADEFLPELPGLALEQDPIHRHKDVLAHTLAVVDRTSRGPPAAAGRARSTTSASPGRAPSPPAA